MEGIRIHHFSFLVINASLLSLFNSPVDNFSKFLLPTFQAKISSETVRAARRSTEDTEIPDTRGVKGVK